LNTRKPTINKKNPPLKSQLSNTGAKNWLLNKAMVNGNYYIITKKKIILCEKKWQQKNKNFMSTLNVGCKKSTT
jgi:hypothetical protein